MERWPTDNEQRRRRELSRIARVGGHGCILGALGSGVTKIVWETTEGTSPPIMAHIGAIIGTGLFAATTEYINQRRRSHDHSEAEDINDRRSEGFKTFFKQGAWTEERTLFEHPHLEYKKLLELRENRSILFVTDDDGTILYPNWQFDDNGVRPDLPRILEAAQYDETSNPIAIDIAMRIKEDVATGRPLHDELGGNSILDALNSEDPELYEAGLATLLRVASATQ